jgi:8-oxo-dGTP diphosphatase
VVRHSGALLLVKRGHPPAKGSWAVPGGKVRLGEALTTAVERELAEETGLAGACRELLAWAEIFSDEGHYVVLDFAVVADDPSLARPGGDAADVAWVRMGEMGGIKLAPGMERLLDALEISSPSRLRLH